jgi:nitrile hydratase subunit beta
MNGVHDMGGMQCFDPVQAEPHEPLFHAGWERQAMALTVAMGATGQWNIDQMRSARESLPPAQYLGMGYYQIWIQALQEMLLARGLVTLKELESGRSHSAPSPGVSTLTRTAVDGVLKRGAPSDRPASAQPLFKVGQQVRARQMHPSGHTRLPRYVRGHIGTVQAIHGFHVCPDVSSQNRHLPPTPSHDQGQWLYNIQFEGADLWGAQAEAGLTVCVDAWESYLERLS